VPEWNQLNCVDSDNYFPLKISRSHRLAVDIQHSDPTVNLSFINLSICATYFFDQKDVYDPEARLSPYIKHLEDLSWKQA
jgi:hypothetical protein